MGVPGYLTAFMSYLVYGTIVGDLWSGITTAVSSAIDTIVSLFQGVVKVFYDETATGDKITVIGWLTISAMAVGFVLFGLRFVKGLIYKMKAR